MLTYNFAGQKAAWCFISGLKTMTQSHSEKQQQLHKLVIAIFSESVLQVQALLQSTQRNMPSVEDTHVARKPLAAGGSASLLHCGAQGIISRDFPCTSLRLCDCSILNTEGISGALPVRLPCHKYIVAGLRFPHAEIH